MAVKDEYDEMRLCCIGVDEEICLYGCGSANDDDGVCRYDDVEDCVLCLSLCICGCNYIDVNNRISMPFSMPVRHAKTFTLYFIEIYYNDFIR